MQFKPGAFIPGAPVQPVLIKYHVPPHMVQTAWYICQKFWLLRLDILRTQSPGHGTNLMVLSLAYFSPSPSGVLGILEPKCLHDTNICGTSNVFYIIYERWVFWPKCKGMMIIFSSELEYLPVYHPSDEEKADPQVSLMKGPDWWTQWYPETYFQLYADNVRALMAKQLQVPLCPLTFAEAKEKFGKKKSL